MIAHDHVDAAFNYLMQYDDAASFPFPSVGGVLHRLDRHSQESAERRLILLRRALEMWRQSPSGRHSHQRDQFVRLFGHHWREFPHEEASAVARMIVDRAMREPDTGTSAGYMNEIHFSSRRQDILFQIFHVLCHLNPAFARYPNGLETMNEEVEAEAKRRKADGATCGGYVLAGDPSDFDRQRRLIDASRSGDFAQSIEDALWEIFGRHVALYPQLCAQGILAIDGRIANGFLIRPGSVSELRRRCYWSKFLTTIFASSHPSNWLQPSFGNGQIMSSELTGREGPDGPRNARS